MRGSVPACCSVRARDAGGAPFLRLCRNGDQMVADPDTSHSEARDFDALQAHDCADKLATCAKLRTRQIAAKHPTHSMPEGTGTLQSDYSGHDYNRWDRGLPGGTPATTTIIICTKLCAHRYISRVRSSQVLIFYVPGSGYYHGRSCPICTRCFHRCSARIPTIPSIVVFAVQLERPFY